MRAHRFEQLKRRSIYGLILIVFWIFFGTVGFNIIEKWGLLDSFYMTVITISTVGYGEVHPLSQAGKLFASFLIFATLASVLYVFTVLGQFFIEGGLLGIFEKRRVMAKVKKLKNHFIVCGYGRMGRMVARGLFERGVPFVIIDSDSGLEEEFKNQGYLYIIGDATEDQILKQAGIKDARAVISLLPSDADNLYVSITAKGIKPDIMVISRALDEKAEVKLLRGGVDKVISPYRIASSRILQAVLKPTVLEFLELVTHREYLPLSMEEIKISPGSTLKGKNLMEAGIKQRYGAIIIAIKRRDGKMVFNPGPETKIEEGDILVAVGKEEDLKRMQEEAES